MCRIACANCSARATRGRGGRAFPCRPNFAICLVRVMCPGARPSARGASDDLGPARPSGRIIRLLLVDDHVVFRAGLRALLSKQAGFVVVGEAGTGEEAVACAKATRPDVVLMDIAMPGEGGLAATRQIAALGLGARILVLTALPQDSQLLDALEAGANGFVEKTAPVEQVVKAIRSVRDTRLFLCPDAAKLVVLQRYRMEGRVEDEKAAVDRLSPREREVLTLLALGFSAREIGRKLAVSSKTVKTYRAHLRDRLGLRHRPELVGFALRTGLLDAR